MGSAAGRLRAAHRLAVWLLPPHRKEWAEAMLNEGAYIGSRWGALQWALGCTLTAFRERLTYELERTFMSRRIFKVLIGLVAVLVLGSLGIYAASKPYQRDRIWITLKQTMRSEQPHVQRSAEP